jgi:hypothetical protein
MQPREPSKAAISPTTFPSPASTVSVAPVIQAQGQANLSSLAAHPPEEPVKKLICAHCATKITYAEGKFCWNNPKRFGGVAFCREHQALV